MKGHATRGVMHAGEAIQHYWAELPIKGRKKKVDREERRGREERGGERERERGVCRGEPERGAMRTHDGRTDARRTHFSVESVESVESANWHGGTGRGGAGGRGRSTPTRAMRDPGHLEGLGHLF